MPLEGRQYKASVCMHVGLKISFGVQNTNLLILLTQTNLLIFVLVGYITVHKFILSLSYTIFSEKNYLGQTQINTLHTQGNISFANIQVWKNSSLGPESKLKGEISNQVCYKSLILCCNL